MILSPWRVQASPPTELAEDVPLDSDEVHDELADSHGFQMRDAQPVLRRKRRSANSAAVSMKSASEEICSPSIHGGQPRGRRQAVPRG